MIFSLLKCVCDVNVDDEVGVTLPCCVMYITSCELPTTNRSPVRLCHWPHSMDIQQIYSLQHYNNAKLCQSSCPWGCSLLWPALLERTLPVTYQRNFYFVYLYLSWHCQSMVSSYKGPLLNVMAQIGIWGFQSLDSKSKLHIRYKYDYFLSPW